MASSCRQVRLNMEKKVEILGKLDKGVKANRLAIEYNVSESAISQIKKKKAEIMSAVFGLSEHMKKNNSHKADVPEVEGKLFEILGKLDKGVRANRLAIEYNVSESAISQIKEKKAEMSEVSDLSKHVKKKTLHKADYPEVEAKLFEWFLKQREKNDVSRLMLKVKAKEIFKQMCPEKNFAASDGWLSKFKRRHGMRFLKECGEILLNDVPNIRPFHDSFRVMTAELSSTFKQVYNAGESRLFYRRLPDKTYISATEKTVPGSKIQNECVTFLLCANTEGTHKTKPLVIGKNKNHLVFKNFDNPLLYDHSKSAGITSKIFRDWFHNAFVREVRQYSVENNLEAKALLLIDNCSAHSPIELLRSDDGKIVAMFLPPNMPAFIQPMQQKPIKIVKMTYRKVLVSKILANQNADIHNLLMQHSIRDAILMLAQAWKELPQTVIKRASSQIFFWNDYKFENGKGLPLPELITQNDDFLQLAHQTYHLLLALAPNSQLSREECDSWNEDQISCGNNESEIESDDTEDN